MMSDSRPEDRKNSGDNVFRGIPVAGDEAFLFAQFLDAHDLAPNSRRAFAQDMRKFGQWFTTANREPLAVKRVTDNRGKRTAGVDGVIWTSPTSKHKAIGTLRRRGYQPQPLRRIYIGV